MFGFYQNFDNQLFRFDILANLNYAPHLHNHLEIVYMLQGEMELKVDFHEKTLLKGDMMICFPNCIHSYKYEKDNRFYILILDLSLTGDFTNKLMKYLPKDPFIEKEQVHNEIRICLDLMYSNRQCFDDNQSGQSLERTAIKGYVQVVLSRMMARLELEKPQNFMDIDLNKRALVYIMEKFKDSELSLEKAAKDLKVSAPYLSRVFQKKIGISYSEYLNNCRIRNAKHLIKTTNCNIMDIAYESGFESISTFNRIFKKITGTTPREYKDG